MHTTNTIFSSDHASLAFQPLIDLSTTSYTNLSSQAATYWLNLDSDPNQLGAFMHFYGSTRKLLRAGGLNLPSDYSDLISSNEKWNRIVAERRLGTSTSLENLYFIRLLYYLGFYEDGMKISEEILSKYDSDQAVVLWALFLRELGYSLTQPFNWTPSQLIEAVISIKPKQFSVLFFEIYLLISKFFVRYEKDPAQGMLWLDKAACLIDTSPPEMIDLITARYQKYLGDWYVLKFQEGEAQNLYTLALNRLLKAKPNIPAQFSYLITETERRILDALAFSYLRNNAYKEALEIGHKAIEIDPYCSYMQALRGSIALHMRDSKLAVGCFQNASLFGVVERSYATFNLSKMNTFALQRCALTQDAADSNLALSLSKQAETENFDLPIEIGRLQSLSDQFTDGSNWIKVKNHKFYQSFLPFWELKASKTPTALASNIPLFALETFLQKKMPWYESLYHQRAMPANFREELFFAVSPNTHFAQSNLEYATSLNSLRDFSPNGEWLVDTSKNINLLSKLDAVLFCRLLGSLGFYQQAIANLPHVEKNSLWSFEDEYSFCTKLFFENIWDRSKLEEDLEFAYNKLSNSSMSLRLRLNLTIISMVYYGQKSNICSLKYWRDRGFQALEKIQECKEFKRFEKELLTSRFYRASSYYPYLIGDHSLLISEAELCENYARNLTPASSREELLKMDNLYPMLESMSRIYFQVGEKNKALSLMEEIILKVDPYDSKAWLQVGDMKEKLGMVEKAKEAFQMAANLGTPLGGLIWFRMGRISEKTDDIEWAKYSYMRSLKFNPKGISPLKRLKVISNDSYINAWCDKSLKNLMNGL